MQEIKSVSCRLVDGNAEDVIVIVMFAPGYSYPMDKLVYDINQFLHHSP